MFSPKAEVGGHGAVPPWTAPVSLLYPAFCAHAGPSPRPSASCHPPIGILPHSWVLNPRTSTQTLMPKPAFGAPFASSSVNSTPVTHDTTPDSLGQPSGDPLRYHSVCFSLPPIQSQVCHLTNRSRSKTGIMSINTNVEAENVRCQAVSL